MTAIGICMTLMMVLSACGTPTPEKIVETVIVEQEGETIVVTATPAPAAVPEAPETIKIGTVTDQTGPLTACGRFNSMTPIV